ncbi:hypothetical protein RBH26_09265 [Natronolimnohabitans sp. A-GB9]|nr:hypothetical protein [Natronolimnohabitans sp. A-GB9]MDQ2050676.1 hypothetical protein [Natronolimnohabitans sp. A-GB9]
MATPPILSLAVGVLAGASPWLYLAIGVLAVVVIVAVALSLAVLLE